MYQADGNVLEDETLRACAKCGYHGTVDEPKDNEGRRMRNLEKILAWQEAKEQYKEQKDDGGCGVRVGEKGKEVSRAPPKPKYEAVPIICHCHQMWNPRPVDPNNNENTCVVRCINPDTDAPYPFDKFAKSTCGYCRCRCIAAYEASAAQDIMVCRLLDRGVDGGS